MIFLPIRLVGNCKSDVSATLLDHFSFNIRICIEPVRDSRKLALLHLEYLDPTPTLMVCGRDMERRHQIT